MHNYEGAGTYYGYGAAVDANRTDTARHVLGTDLDGVPYDVVGRLPHAGMNARYGLRAIGGPPEAFKPLQPQPVVRMSARGVLVSILLPCVLFAAMLYSFSFTMHYKTPVFTWIVAAIGFLVVGVPAQAAASGTSEVLKPKTAQVLVLTTLLSWSLSIALGQSNYLYNMQAYYNLNDLNEYRGVNVSHMSGIHSMDAGIVQFTRGHRIDSSLAIGFKNDYLYCVAPITNGNEKLRNYDYWAVGENCCSGEVGDFHCGDYKFGRSPAGLRVLHPTEIQFYDLAVHRAAATYKIEARHPVFLYWTADPQNAVESFRDHGRRFFIQSAFAFLVFEVFVVCLQFVMFAKLRLA
jgi:hypothetical protein